MTAVATRTVPVLSHHDYFTQPDLETNAQQKESATRPWAYARSPSRQLATSALERTLPAAQTLRLSIPPQEASDHSSWNATLLSGPIVHRASFQHANVSTSLQDSPNALPGLRDELPANPASLQLDVSAFVLHSSLKQTTSFDGLTQRSQYPLNPAKPVGLPACQSSPQYQQSAGTGDACSLSSVILDQSYINDGKYTELHAFDAGSTLPPSAPRASPASTISSQSTDSGYESDLSHHSLRKTVVKQNSRRCGFKSAQPPSLPRQADASDCFVKYIISFAVVLVASVWPNSGHGRGISLFDFISESLRRSKTSYSTLQVALFYIIMLKARLPKDNFTGEQMCGVSDIALQCGRRMFLSVLMLASKYLQDKTYSSTAWSKITGLSCADINKHERLVLKALDYQLHVPKDTFNNWNGFVVDLCQRTRNGPWTLKGSGISNSPSPRWTNFIDCLDCSAFRCGEQTETLKKLCEYNALLIPMCQTASLKGAVHPFTPPASRSASPTDQESCTTYKKPGPASVFMQPSLDHTYALGSLPCLAQAQATADKMLPPPLPGPSLPSRGRLCVVALKTSSATQPNRIYDVGEIACADSLLACASRAFDHGAVAELSQPAAGVSHPATSPQLLVEDRQVSLYNKQTMANTRNHLRAELQAYATEDSVLARSSHQALQSLRANGLTYSEADSLPRSGQGQVTPPTSEDEAELKGGKCLALVPESRALRPYPDETAKVSGAVKRSLSQNGGPVKRRRSGGIRTTKEAVHSINVCGSKARKRK